MVDDDYDVVMAEGKRGGRKGRCELWLDGRHWLIVSNNNNPTNQLLRDVINSQTKMESEEL